MEVGFEKATNQNLPVVDMFTIVNFFKNNPNFQDPEVRNVKTSSAARETYGDNAIGYVQLKRENEICEVRAKITPEHKIHQTAYIVQATINERDQVIVDGKCLSCAASEGGCKHIIALLFWLHHRSEEPSVTSVDCYWRASKLSKVGTSLKFITIQDLCKKGVPREPEISDDFFKEAAEEAQQLGSHALVFEEKFGSDLVSRICLHQLSLKAKSVSAEAFIQYLKNTISDMDCKLIEQETELQGKSSSWYKARYGRITASILYETARCETIDGSLVNRILGANRKIETPAMARGKAMEEAVLKELSDSDDIKNIKTCGMFLKREYPIFGASPDGLTETHVIEIKCPYRKETVKNYYDEKDKVSKKPLLQIQLQMFLTGKKNGYFCVADPDFETSRNIAIFEVKLNDELMEEAIKRAEAFWKKAVFPRLH